jgi:endogenous inhibitor of DNA gyrase (YacG/DUF329 family)
MTKVREPRRQILYTSFREASFRVPCPTCGHEIEHHWIAPADELDTWEQSATCPECGGGWTVTWGKHDEA